LANIGIAPIWLPFGFHSQLFAKEEFLVPPPMRKILVLIVLLIAAAGFLIFTAPGNRVLSAFGVTMPTDCMKAQWLDRLGYHVPQCTCGNCSAPFTPQPTQ
jgi:hypothetical protein